MNLLANTVEEDDSSVQLLLDTIESDLTEYESKTKKSKIIISEGSSVTAKVSSTTMSDAQLKQTSAIISAFSQSSSYSDLITSSSVNSVATNIAESLGNVLSQSNLKNHEELKSSGRNLKAVTVGERQQMALECQNRIVELANIICEGLGDTYSKQQVDTEEYTLFV
mmetsp:Transcript_17671/g.12590  ORF Transcript_17671/g.12590 Transcript_17671/m.12590 type:complete len:167 (+) Transcript_17671:2033-2533(+)|eukprot:CAMPEP_0202978962 /NCGR_PEP_ID=MMETSP1396-20130829/85233_1 /ASSEMBLY_ACC=CAM_ASM_000872 /TAXON_ID= /ORGANISM="Pseudokeronopsis sp., Strain Brazil" /LENGTH=166 /DNA_ID=CAMNT_0049718163 /DNA_START=3294 /DNA_END=3794 /DNA_ORIENTATION=-